MKAKDYRKGVRRSLSFDQATDRLLTEVAGQTGNVSELVRHAVHAVYGVKGDPGDLSDRAKAYLRAKEAGMAFEAHVGEIVQLSCPELRRGETFNSGGSVFVADFWIPVERPVAIVCKSHVSEDRLLLALGECLVGLPRVGDNAQIWVVIPYSTAESDKVMTNYAGIPRVKMLRISELAKALLEI